MTLQEFSDQFDVLYNSITSNQAPGLNEYEKSVFLTKGEKQLVREYFNKRVDGVGGGFDGSEKRLYDFSCLLRTESLYNVNTYADRIDETEKIDRRSLVFLFPENYFLSVNEILSDSRWQYSVLPIDYQEYQRLMLKPYNLPVKRGAWRLITDKKNCNYWREYTTATIESEEVNTDVDYVFVSTWADQKRKLRITINSSEDKTLPEEGTESGQIIYPNIYSDHTIFFMYEGARCKMTIVKSGWEESEDKLYYEVNINLSAFDLLDDETTIEAIKEGFRTYVAKTPNYITAKTNLAKACRHTDGFAQASAPSKLSNFATGKTFETDCILLPMVEIIGKFRGDVKYQMRYVRTLKPIILDNLTNYGDDLSIDNYQNAMECELPQEMHEEILERAVTLAKIAWQGGTATIGALSNNKE